MIRHVKDFLKELLAAHGYRISWTSSQMVGGVELGRDLRILLGQRSPVCFDVGANEGQTLEILTTSLDHPVIHAFEPSPEQFRLLEKHWTCDGIHLHPLGLGSQNSSMEINLYDKSVLNSLLPLETNIGHVLPDTSRVGSKSVQVVTLDDYFTGLGLERIDLLKIDTQGFDFEVLKGASRLFAQQRIAHVLIELNHMPLYVGQCSPAEVHSFLAGQGFRLVDLYEKVRTNKAIDWCTALFQHCPS